MKKMKIHLYFSLLKRKCAFIERFNLTIKQILYKIMFHNSSLKWKEFLPQAMEIYLSREHRSIKMLKFRLFNGTFDETHNFLI